MTKNVCIDTDVFIVKIVFNTGYREIDERCFMTLNDAINHIESNYSNIKRIGNNEYQYYNKSTRFYIQRLTFERSL